MVTTGQAGTPPGMAMVMAMDTATGVEGTPGTIMTTMMGTTITMAPIMMMAMVTTIKAITSPMTRLREITSIGRSIRVALSSEKTGSQADQQARFQAARDQGRIHVLCQTGIPNDRDNPLP
jgi:hypothetical protein